MSLGRLKAIVRLKLELARAETGREVWLQTACEQNQLPKFASMVRAPVSPLS